MREGVKMRRFEDEKMRYRPPLLEEPCAQTLSGKINEIETMEKSTEPMANSMKPMEKSMKTWGKSMNHGKID